MHHYASLLISNILDNPFTNVTLYGIEKVLPRIVGSLPGDREQHPPCEGANEFPSQVIVEINMVVLSSKGSNEVSSVSYTLTSLVGHIKA